MTDFRIAALSLITPWTVLVVCLILLGISVYYCAVDKKARDRADREQQEYERRYDAARKEMRQGLADFAKQRTRETERRIEAVRHE